MSVDWEELIPHIAHDGRALVRKGLLNAQFLERLLTLPPDGKPFEHLRAIIESQIDLNRFLSRLVTLAEAHRVSATRAEETVVLEVAILGARLECRDAIQQSGAEVVIRQLPACTVPQRTQAVVKELIDNSLRYLDPSRGPRVIIEAEADELRTCVRIADNGTGVPPAYWDKLFRPLQRLDAARSGFGLGLAICRAMVESAGGSIHIEPSDIGARFVFELPNPA